MALDRLCCPRRAAPAALGSVEGLPAVALSLAARSLTVGHSKRLTMDRFCFTSFRIMAITWTAFKEVPPASKKLASQTALFPPPRQDLASGAGIHRSLLQPG